MDKRSDAAVVERMMDAIRRQDYQLFRETLSPSIRWHTGRVGETLMGSSVAAQTGIAASPDQVLEFLRALERAVEWEESEVEAVLSDQGRVVVLARERLRVHATGETVMQHVAIVFTVRDGQVQEMRSYEDTAALGRAFRFA